MKTQQLRTLESLKSCTVSTPAEGVASILRAAPSGENDFASSAKYGSIYSISIVNKKTKKEGHRPLGPSILDNKA